MTLDLVFEKAEKKYGIDYFEQRKHPLWKAKQARILKRDGYTCRLCGSRLRVTVHHLYYHRGTMLWEYPDDQLITYCVHCHNGTHYQKRSMELTLGHCNFNGRCRAEGYMQEMSGIYEYSICPLQEECEYVLAGRRDFTGNREDYKHGADKCKGPISKGAVYAISEN